MQKPRALEEKAMTPHSSTLAWKIPWTEEPGRLQSMGSLRVRYDWGTSLSRIGEGKGKPFQCSCLENPRDRGAWWAAVYGVAKSRTRLKRLSSSSGRAFRKVAINKQFIFTNGSYYNKRELWEWNRIARFGKAGKNKENFGRATIDIVRCRTWTVSLNKVHQWVDNGD